MQPNPPSRPSDSDSGRIDPASWQQPGSKPSSLSGGDPAAGSERTLHPTVVALLDRPRYELHHHHGPDCYDATDHHLHRRVLLTRASVALNSFDEVLFLREARILSRLSHPSIPLLHDMGHLEGRAFFTTDYSEGRALDAMSTDSAEPPALSSLLRAFLATCSAISHAHERDIIHGAVDPSSIQLGAFGHTWVMGWQNAISLKLDPRLAGGASAETTHVSPFSAPERVANGPLDFRTDVWGLGALLHWILWNRPPAADQASEPDTSGRSPPPAELAAVAKRALSARPSRRYETVDDLAEDVRSWLDGRGVSVAPTSFTLAAWRLLARHRASAAVVLTSACLVLGGGALTLSRVAYSWTLARRNESAARLKREQARDNLTLAEASRHEAEGNANQARSRTLFEERLQLARAKATSRNPLEPRRLFDDAEQLARQLEPADLARLLRHRGEWSLHAGRPTEALADFDQLVDLDPRDPDGQLGRFLAARRLPGVRARDTETNSLAAMAALPSPLSEISSVVPPLREAEDAFSQGRGEDASRLAEVGAQQVSELCDLFPHMALLHELRSRALTCLAGPGYQGKLKRGSAANFENAFRSAVRAISLDPVEPRSRQLLTSQWTEKYGLHESWRWIAGWYHRHLAKAARLSQRPEPLIDLVEAAHLAGQAKATLAPCERLLEMCASPVYDGSPLHAHAHLLQARARLTNGLEVQEALPALKVPASRASEWLFLLGRDQLVRGETGAGLESLAEGLRSFNQSQNGMQAQADLMEALLEPRADRQALLTLLNAWITPDNNRFMLKLVAVRLTLLSHLAMEARVDVNRLFSARPSASTLDAVLLMQGYARRQLHFEPSDPMAHVMALRAWAQCTFFPVTRGPFLAESRRLIRERLLRLGNTYAAEIFDLENTESETWVPRIWEPPIFGGDPTNWESR